MYLTITFAAIFAIFFTTMAIPLERRGNPAITCQTTSGSPSVNGVNVNIGALSDSIHDGFPTGKNTNKSHSRCTEYEVQTDATISLCGDEETLKAQDILNYVVNIRDTCQNHGQVGGTYQVNPNLRVEVSQPS